ncbi:hypothetical protein J2Z40_000585 [Cytobacillus eiseniae]|uniref:Fur-regulated basic protein FbpA n=1 Tax=Cytobacillus eiseniae TaxID=762947 RepID=A0ABS4RDX2_9BACI|nr:hypothetical protein [Cytobacillus eiseniae]MBP2240032.1 hypothetical protein [Cytobacillus eiseniae]
MMELYLEKMDLFTQSEENMTNYLFLDKLLLKEKKETYDIAELTESVQQMKAKLQQGREGTR